MGFDAFNFFQTFIWNIVNSYISIPISAGDKFSIMSKSNTSYCLLNYLVFSNLYFFILCLVIILNHLTIFTSIYWFCFKIFKILFLWIFRILNKYYFAHIFTVSISLKTFLNSVFIQIIQWLLINKMPESYCSVTWTCNKSS